MKTTLLLCALAAHAFAATPVLVRVTPEALAKLQHQDPMLRLVKATEADAKAEPPQARSIIEQSTILNDGTHWTLIPNGALVYLPEAMKQRVNARPVGTLLPWIAFLTKNRSWITTSEVSFDQAVGNKPLPAERAGFWAKQDKIVVAVLQNGPISVAASKIEPNLASR